MPVVRSLSVASGSILLAACSTAPQQIAVREFDSVADTVSVGADLDEAVAKLAKLGYECRDAVGDGPDGRVNFKQCSKLAAGGFPKCTVELRIDLIPRSGRIGSVGLNSTGKCQ